MSEKPRVDDTGSLNSIEKKNTEEFKVLKKAVQRHLDSFDNNPPIYQSEKAHKTISINGKIYFVGEDNFLDDFHDWDPLWIAYHVWEDNVQKNQKTDKEENVFVFTDSHLEVLMFDRGYYEHNGIAPIIRIVTKAINIKLKEIYNLYPEGPTNGICKTAGLPKHPLHV